MKKTLVDGKLIICLDGRLDSNNSELISDEIFATMESNPHTSLVIDAGELKYLSSAGIRVILGVAKKEKNFEIINASKEAYEIFEMTGLTSILKIEKRKRKISLENLELIGNGFFSDVYRINKDTIAKVFTKTLSDEDVKRELELAKEAFVLGIPTAISYDIVEADEKPGVIFEMLNCDSLKDAILKHPEKLDEYMKRYARLLLDINNIDAKNSNLPNAKNVVIDKLIAIKEFFTDEEYKSAYEFFNNLEDTNTIIHGDCQIKNIMMNDDELILIDMDTLSKGNPIFELASLHEAYVAFPEVQKGEEGKFLGIPNELPNKIFDKVIKYYFSNLNDEELSQNIEKIALVSYLDMMYWFKKNDEYSKEDFDYMCSRFKDILKNI